MPTGYTARLVDKGQTFEEFVWTCARGMGALIMMRDDPMDAPVPERFEPSGYHKERISEAIALRARLEAMNNDERIAYGMAKRNEGLDRARKYLADEQAQNERLDAMLSAVGAWTPPTSDHEGMKKFMLEQLRISRQDSAWARKSLAEDAAKSPMDCYAMDAAKCEHDIAYHTAEHEKEVARTEERNKWLAALRDSLKVTA